MHHIGPILATLVLLAACGDDDEPASPASPAAAPTAAPTAVPGETETPTTQAAEGSSVRTAAPEPATGCPATDVAAQLARPGTVHDRGIVAQETADLAGSPHRFPRGIGIGDGAVLTIEPCALVLVGDGGAVSVTRGGTLVAEGTAEQPVRIDSESPDPAPGQWLGIHISADARPQTRFAHAVIEDAGAGHQGAAIYVDGEHALTVKHVMIRHSGQHGVRLHHEARFSDDSEALTITESGREDPYSAPVSFFSASQVRTLPDGEYSGNAYDEIHVDRGHVRTTGTWRNPGVRYRLKEGVTVGSDNGAVLTIAPGTTLAFAAGKTLAVGFRGDGGLVLDGESEETPITLTSARPHPAAGDWGGVRLGQHRADAVTKLAHVVIEHAGSETSHPHTVGVRWSCRDSAAAAVSVQHHDLGPKVTHTVFRSLPASATAILLGFRGDATDYLADEHGNDFSEAGTDCRQNAQPEGDCPDPACR